MLIGPGGKRLHDFTIKVNVNTTSHTSSTKYLGCTLMINLLGQNTLPTLRELPRAVLEFPTELDTI